VFVAADTSVNACYLYPLYRTSLTREKVYGMTRVKTVLIGDSGVGKTCVYSRLDSCPWDEAHVPTIGGGLTDLMV
jgi:GTPase SAR1 family protein